MVVQNLMIKSFQDLSNINAIYKMNVILLIIAVIFFVAAIIIGSVTPDSWKSTGITWGCLIIGILLFGVVLTL